MLEIILAVLDALGIVVDVIVVAQALKKVLADFGPPPPAGLDFEHRCDCHDPDDLDDMNDLDDGRAYIWNRRTH